MFSEAVIEELRKRYYYVSHNFGGPDDLVSSIRSVYDSLSTEERVHRLLSHPGYLAVISPWKPYLRLDEEYVLHTKAYSVYTVEGRFLYRVKNHDGVFGNSILDKTLILQSLSGSIYYLQYQAIDNYKTVLLLVNNLALTPSLPTTDKSYLEAPDPPILEPSEYYLILDASQVLSNEILNNINIHFLPTNAINLKTADDIISSSISTVEPFTLSSSDSTLMWFPQRSGWLTITKGVNNLQSLLIDDVLGTGDDRLIYSGNGSYYIALGNEEDTNMIRQELGLVTRRPAGFTTANKIKLTGSLITNG